MASEREIAFARYWEGKEGRKLTVDVVRDAYLAGWSDKPAPSQRLMGLSSDEAHLLIRVLKAKIKDDNSKHFNGKLWGHEIVDLAAMERLIERIETETCLWDCADAPMDVCPTFGKPCPSKSSPSPQPREAGAP